MYVWVDYYDLISQIDVGWNGSGTVYYEFENEGEQRALVYRALYSKQGNSGSRDYIIDANCCSCTQIVLVVPCGHPLAAYGGSQVSFDMRKPMLGSSLGGIVQEEVPLEENLPYYLVIYRNGYEGNCPDHDAYTSGSFVFEPADLQ